MSDRKPSVSPQLAGVILVLMVLTLYILSSGPAFLWLSHDPRRYETIQTVYAPLLWLADKSETVRGIQFAYTTWWARLGGPTP